MDSGERDTHHSSMANHFADCHFCPDDVWLVRAERMDEDERRVNLLALALMWPMMFKRIAGEI